MSDYMQAVAAALLAVVLILVIGKHSADLATLLGIGVCCLVAILAVRYLKTVMDFSAELQALGKLDNDMVRLLWKVVGVASVSEIASLICADSGNSAMGKTLEMLAVIVIVYLSIPMMRALLELIGDIMGKV